MTVGKMQQLKYEKQKKGGALRGGMSEIRWMGDQGRCLEMKKE